MRSAICFLPHLATNTHVAPWLISTGCCKKGRAHPWVAVGSGDRSWAPSAPRDKSFARSSPLQSCLKAAEQRGRAPPILIPMGTRRAPCAAGAAQLQGTSTARAEPRAPSASSLSPSVELSARHASCPEGRKAVGGKNTRFGVSERGFRTGSRHKHRSAAESISLFCLLAGQRGEGLLLAPAPESSQGARGSVLPAAFGLGRYIKHFTAPK